MAYLGMTLAGRFCLRRCLHFYIALDRITTYTDACCEPRPNEEIPFLGLCYVALDSSRAIRRGGTAVLSNDIIQGFNERIQYIA